MLKDLMLYFHIPFCISKCAYCAFYSIPGWDEALLDSYTDALINQVFAFENSGDYKILSVYFGGGTPTILGAERLCRVLAAVKERFCIDSQAEITLEANPKTVDETGLRALKEGGFNRLSLGAQSFNDSTLRLLNRAHTAADFQERFASARRAGFDNISADLIFALPNENIKMLENSVNKLISLAPEHISVYGLSIEEGTPLYLRKKEYAFPTEEGEEAQYEMLCKLLGEAGYSHYEISNFATVGKEARHNTGYWKRIPYFGFGAGAHSFFNERRFATPASIADYIAKASGGLLAPTDYHSSKPVSAAEAEEERIMLGLRMKEGVKIDESRVPPIIIKQGLGVYQNGVLALTERGFRVSNTLINMILS